MALCRRLLLVVSVAAALAEPEAAMLEPAQPPCCPNCGSLRLVYGELDPVAPGSPGVVALADSS